MWTIYLHTINRSPSSDGKVKNMWVCCSTLPVWVLAVEKLKLYTLAGHRTRNFWSFSMYLKAFQTACWANSF